MGGVVPRRRLLDGIDHPRQQRTNEPTRHHDQACRDDARHNCKKPAWDPDFQTGLLVGSAREMATSNRCCKVGLGRDASGRAMCCPKCCRWDYFLEGPCRLSSRQPRHGCWPVRPSGRHLLLRDGKERLLCPNTKKKIFQLAGEKRRTEIDKFSNGGISVVLAGQKASPGENIHGPGDMGGRLDKLRDRCTVTCAFSACLQG
jgi:hypothetical protein